jgi:hypothetical protein
MKKREFLATTLGSTVLSSTAPAAPQGRHLAGPGLLTVTGAIDRGNRGPVDAALDQMMVKQQISFERAYVFDFNALLALPSTTIRPTLEYDNKVHVLKGPLLTELVKATGANLDERASVLLRAVDGYTVTLDLAQAQHYGFIVATHLDSKPIPLGGLGPLWAMYDADRFADRAAKPVNERFVQCPWGLYHLEVRAI